MICCLKPILVLFGLSCRQTFAGGCVGLLWARLAQVRLHGARWGLAGISPRPAGQPGCRGGVFFGGCPGLSPAIPDAAGLGRGEQAASCCLLSCLFPFLQTTSASVWFLCVHGGLFIFSARLRRSLFLFSSFLHCCFMRCVLLLQVCGCVCCCPAWRPAAFGQIPPLAAGFLLTYPQLATFWLASDRGANADSVNR